MFSAFHGSSLFSFNLCPVVLPGPLCKSFHGLIHVRKATWRLFLERIRQEWDKQTAKHFALRETDSIGAKWGDGKAMLGIQQTWDQDMT